MAYDPKEPSKPSGREPLPPGAPPAASGPVPFGREDLSDDDLHDTIGRIWGRRNDRYSEVRSSRTEELPRVEMSYIGG